MHLQHNDWGVHDAAGPSQVSVVVEEVKVKVPH